MENYGLFASGDFDLVTFPVNILGLKSCYLLLVKVLLLILGPMVIMAVTQPPSLGLSIIYQRLQQFS